MRDHPHFIGHLPLRTALSLLGSLLLASALCVATVELRTWRTDDPTYRFLDWNLFLAWIPLVLALGASELARRKRGYLAAMLGVLWLLFFPNAPYIVTDFIHLHESSSTPLWYDGLMLSAFAWTGLLLGFVSLLLMQTIVRKATNSSIAWVGAIGALALASFGIYLGRFELLNSWDALLHPVRVAHLVLRQDGPLHPQLEGSLLALTVCLTIAYLAFFNTTVLRLELRNGGPKTRRPAVLGRGTPDDPGRNGESSGDLAGNQEPLGKRSDPA